MWIKVLRSLEGEEEGSWMPTFMGRECCVARDWRPSTKGEVLAGWHNERDSLGLWPR